MLAKQQSYEYFLGEELTKVGDWLIEISADPNLKFFHVLANMLLDRLEQDDPQCGEECPSEDWMKWTSQCWGLSEYVENYVSENMILSDTHVQPDWPTIYDYRDDGRQLI